MTMKLALIFALGITSTAALVSAHAQTYQWKDNNGRTVISDSPPPGTAKTKRAIGEAPAATGFVETPAPSEKKAEAPQTTAEKDLEFKKRQQEAREKAEKAEKELAAAREKQANCENARRNLAALESNQPIASLDEKGERQAMDINQRNQEMERARRFMAESCK